MYNNGTSWVVLAKGTAGQVLTQNSGETAPEWADASGGGIIVQVVNTSVVTSSTGTGHIPVDDTIPQNTEGDEYMTLAITPTSATNILHIQVLAHLATSSASANISGALFQDDTAGALDADVQYNGQVANANQKIVIDHWMVAGTTSETTFKFRAGDHASGTITFNGNSGSRVFGGVMSSSITITEILV